MRYYFLGICGIAMGSLAVLLKKKGHQVWGTDVGVYPPMSDFLQEHDIPVYEGYDVQHLDQEFDQAVIGNALSRGNPEVEAILNRRLPFTSLPELIRREFISTYRPIVITGTHGKTTTTALMSWVLEVAGLSPTFLIGGISRNFNSSIQLGQSEWFVIEGDEYDCAFFDKRPKFVHYFPEYLIINNIEFDHADIYPNLEAIKDQFRKLLRLVPSSGLVVANGDSATVREVTQTVYSRLQHFGKESEWSYRLNRSDSQGQNFEVLKDGEMVAELSFPSPGEYQIQNALAVTAIARDIGIDWKTLQKAFQSFKGVKRRFEYWGRFNGAEVYDDFAHHPTAIAATLSAARKKFPQQRIIALFEPRTNTMVRNFFQEQLVDSFSAADTIIITPIHRQEKLAPEERLSLVRLSHDLEIRGKEVRVLVDYSELLPVLQDTLKKGDILIVLTNGSLGGKYQEFRDLVQYGK
ncbi:MAG: UDP-N-acetylmuramate:L-alanyl-gamma-D-glutamyl-meso-diaminopimelate ligase [Calditrichaeota bacterium]|nr:MAG: UDP-N-acetylmuramate:L-alanyl-gamma-D-glutamyl-meso-diaminopimelate ligase [Calditrichota bacterium]